MDDTRTRPLVAARPVAPVAPVPVAPRPRRDWDYLRGLAPLQVICWQLAVLGVLLAIPQPWPVLLAASAGAAAVLALTGLRVGGRWLYEVAWHGAVFLTRPRRGDLPKSGGVPGTTLALLERLRPGATTLTIETPQGPAMAISHRDGMTAQLTPSALTPELLGRLPMPASLLPAGADQVFGVQLVLHVRRHPDKPRRLWVAVHAARSVETATDEELALALRNAMRRVRRALGRAGVPVWPLGDEQALSAIAGLAHITGDRTEVREDWRYWRTGPVCQATYRLAGWDRLTDPQARALLDRLLAGVPGVASTVTLGVRTGGRGTHGTLRLAATAETDLVVAARQLTGRLPGVRLTPCDGAQLPGVAASLPIGVFQS